MFPTSDPARPSIPDPWSPILDSRLQLLSVFPISLISDPHFTNLWSPHFWSPPFYYLNLNFHENKLLQISSNTRKLFPTKYIENSHSRKFIPAKYKIVSIFVVFWLKRGHFIILELHFSFAKVHSRKSFFPAKDSLHIFNDIYIIKTTLIGFYFREY